MRTDGPTDGQTDMTKIMVAFRNFANAPKIYLCMHGNQRMSIPLCGYCHTRDDVSATSFRHFRAQCVAVHEIPRLLKIQQFLERFLKLAVLNLQATVTRHVIRLFK
jgi:hypothetical protein